jgi:beta-galactosidase
MQPERLGPYVSTLNPGYDASLPLYRPWPMFSAIHDADTGNTNSLWAHRPSLNTANQTATPAHQTNSVAAYVPENGSSLAKALSKSGVELHAYTNGVKTDFLLVDGSTDEAPENTAALKTAVNAVLENSGTVWIWNVTPAGAPTVTKLLGEEVSAEPRIVSSFITKENDPLLAGLDNASLYFSEGDDWRQMSNSLAGSFVKNAKVVLEACPADWRQWNYKPEPVKTAALFRSEMERTTSLAAIVIRQVGSGHVILCNLNPEIRSTRKSGVIARLFQNEGISLSQVNSQNEFLDAGGRLVRALACGSFSVSDAHDAYAVKLPESEIKEGASANNRRWRTVEADGQGVFDFRTGLVRGPQENAYAYLAVWIKSPKPLNDLLSEPNLPKLSFTYGSDDGCEVWLNGELLARNERTGPLEPNGFTINPLLLKLGWNQLVIKVVQASGEWKFTGAFGCSDVSFLQKLEFGTSRETQ